MKPIILFHGSVFRAALVLSCTFVALAHSEPAAPSAGAKTSVIKVTSPAISSGGVIPVKYTCEGGDTSPPLAWTGVPEGAKSLALICDDPDAPGKTWVHWVLYDLAPGTTELAEKLPASAALPNGARQGTNDFGKTGYGGPCPPPSKAHRYFFKVYALDTELSFKSPPTKADLLREMEHHVIGQGQFMATYQRKK